MNWQSPLWTLWHWAADTFGLTEVLEPLSAKAMITGIWREMCYSRYLFKSALQVIIAYDNLKCSLHINDFKM